jgi:hypothetical protein
MFNFFNFFSFFKNKGVFYFNSNHVCNTGMSKFLFFFISKKFLFYDLFLLKKKNSINFIFFNRIFGFNIHKQLIFGNVLESNSIVIPIMEWYERELKEFNFFLFKNIKDSRCLLTPYNKNLKKTNFNYLKSNFVFFNSFLKKLNTLSKLKIRL